MQSTETKIITDMETSMGRSWKFTEEY
jgi:hypothetical protein